jgi:hypothetical protein
LTDLPTPSATRLKPPSWLDGRLVVGVVLVLLSVLVGAKVLAASDRYDLIWAASHDVAPGTILTKADLAKVKVRFHDHGTGYFAATGASLVGRTTTQSLAGGQLIPTGSVPMTAPAQTRLVTVPVAKLHMPRGSDLQGVQVDLYVTVKASGSEAAASPQLVLANVTVADTINDSSGLGGSSGSGVVLSVPQPYVDDVVAAVEAGSIDVVRVPANIAAAQPSPGSFTPPAATPSVAASAAAAASASS